MENWQLGARRPWHAGPTEGAARCSDAAGPSTARWIARYGPRPGPGPRQCADRQRHARCAPIWLRGAGCGDVAALAAPVAALRAGRVSHWTPIAKSSAFLNPSAMAPLHQYLVRGRGPGRKVPSIGSTVAEALQEKREQIIPKSAVRWTLGFVHAAQPGGCGFDYTGLEDWARHIRSARRLLRRTCAAASDFRWLRAQPHRMAAPFFQARHFGANLTAPPNRRAVTIRCRSPAVCTPDLRLPPTCGRLKAPVAFRPASTIGSRGQPSRFRPLRAVGHVPLTTSIMGGSGYLRQSVPGAVRNCSTRGAHR